MNTIVVQKYEKSLRGGSPFQRNKLVRRAAEANASKKQEHLHRANKKKGLSHNPKDL